MFLQDLAGKGSTLPRHKKQPAITTVKTVFCFTKIKLFVFLMVYKLFCNFHML